MHWRIWRNRGGRITNLLLIDGEMDLVHKTGWRRVTFLFRLDEYQSLSTVECSTIENHFCVAFTFHRLPPLSLVKLLTSQIDYHYGGDLAYRSQDGN